MSLPLQTIRRLLLAKTPLEISQIKAGAEAVVLGLTQSISALNQSATFDRDDGAVVLEACLDVEAILKSNPDATAASVAPSTLSHQMRASSQFLMGP